MTNDYFLLKVDKQSPLTGIDSSPIFREQVGTAIILYWQIDIKSGIFSSFRIKTLIHKCHRIAPI